ncbi:MAG: hypothetical protein ACK5B9_12295 [Flavobacteriia bacterium]|jgi:uncharacterized protein (UPF0335 family)
MEYVIPNDIEKKIYQLFSNEKERKEVENKIKSLYSKNWGVGFDQLTRSIIFLSDGKLEEFKNIIKEMEPRDLILDAERKAGNPKHYFCIPFDKIDKLIKT